jgi:hypothetical protein
MNRKLITGFLPITALLAMAAISAPGAFAGYHSETSHTLIQGSQIGETTFTVNAGTIRCNSVTYSGTLSTQTSESIAGEPKYAECTAFGFISSPVDANGCTTVFTTQPAFIDHRICHSAPVTVTAFNCWVTIGSQTVGGNTMVNEGAGSSRDLRFTINASGITYTQHSKSFPGCANGTFTNGKQTASATLRGFNTSGGQVGIWKE